MEPFEIHYKLKKFKTQSGVKMAEKKRAIKTAENEFFYTWNEDFSEEMIETMEDIGDDIADDMMEMIKWNEDYPGPPVWDLELDEIEAEEEQQGEPVWDYEPEEGERQIINLDRIEEPANQQLNTEITEEQENDQQLREAMVEFTWEIELIEQSTGWTKA